MIDFPGAVFGESVCGHSYGAGAGHKLCHYF